VTGREPWKWSRDRVLDELRRLHRQGQRLAPADLVRDGRLDLIGAAMKYAGGLRRARRLAGLPAPPRAAPNKKRREDEIVAEIKLLAKRRQPLASSRAPQDLVTAARWRFGSWRAALVAAGIDPETARLSQLIKYTRKYIITKLRREARAGSDLRAITLAKVLKLEAVRREYGTLRAAIVDAGLGPALEHRKHGLQKWSRDRVVEELRARARRGEFTLTPGLHRVVQLYFGGAEAARKAAGVPSPREAREIEKRQTMKRQREARRAPTRVRRQVLRR